MGNWALYGALSGTDNWQQKRQDRNMDLMLSEKMEQRAKEDLQAEMDIEEGINKYIDEINSFDVLAEDQERVNEAERQAKMNIIKGITKFNGDLKRYMASGGISELHEYKRNVLNSDAVKNAKSNKQSYAMYVDAMRNGKFVGKANVEVPVYDKDGNPKSDKDGKTIMETKSLSMEQQMALFKKGLISKINIGNIEDKVKVDAFDFKKVYKDDTKPWAQDNLVTERDVYSVALQRGASEEQARAMASDYAKGLTPETAWKFKSMNDVELMEAKAKMELAKARAQKARGGFGGTDHKMVTNTVAPIFKRLKEGEMVESSAGKKGTSVPINNQEREYWQSYIKNRGGSVYDAHYGSADEETRKDGYGQYDITNARDITPIEYVKMKIPGTNKVEPMIKARVVWDEDLAPDNVMEFDDNRHNMGWKEIGYKKEDGSWETEDVVQGYVYVPLGKEIRSKNFTTGLNKKLGYHTRMHGSAPSMTNEMQNQAMMNQAQVMGDKMVQEGYDPEEVSSYMYDKYGVEYFY